jgi:small subunit ribosomal protein S2
MATAQTEVGIRELLEAGVHFGHQTRRWNPKMRRFIHGEREGIYIIDLLKTETLLRQAQEFAAGVARRGGTVLFVGTKKGARDAVKDAAEACGMPYVHNRWLGGLLTNFQTISLRIKRLHDLERWAAEGQLQLLPTRERMAAEADLTKLQANLGGVKNMQRVPDAVFVIDLNNEEIAVREAQRLRIPIIGLVDTNCDPDRIEYVIPGNDDGLRSCGVIANAIASTVQEERSAWQAAEEERIRREAEEAARRAAEEQARKEAEEAAKAEAEAALTQGGEGMPRQDAEKAVADAVAERGRPPVEGRRQAEAAAAAQAADEPAMPKGGSSGETRREVNNPNAGERTPQAAGAPQAQGAPASDTAGTEPDAGVAEPKGAAKARKPRAPKAAAPAPEPGPSEPAAEAMAETPPAEPEAAAPQATPEAPEATEATEAAPAEESGDDTSVVDQVQDVANGAVDAAQDVVSGVADTAAGAAEAVEEAVPAPAKPLARVAKRAAKAVADATKNTDDEKTDEQKDEK